MAYTRLEPEEYAVLCEAILQRDLWKCRSCGFRNNLHVHHIEFRSMGGPDVSWNLVTLCTSCHDGVHTNVKDSRPGLIITFESPSGANDKLRFSRREDWRPT